MLNILLIDDWLLNNKVIEQDSSEYFEDNNIKYNFLKRLIHKMPLKFCKKIK